MENVKVSPQDRHLLDGGGWRISSGGYVVRSNKVNGKPAVESLHRLIMSPPDGKVVDHINGDPLDNRRENLRVCFQSNNAKNRDKHGNNKSGVKGVSVVVLAKLRRKVYRAAIRVDGVKYSLGTYGTVDEARDAYNRASVLLHGQYGRPA